MGTDRLTVEGTDLEVVAYVNAGGNLVVRINKAGICVADIGIANATAELSPNALMNVGALTQPVLRDLLKPELLDALAGALEQRGPRPLP